MLTTRRYPPPNCCTESVRLGANPPGPAGTLIGIEKLAEPVKPEVWKPLKEGVMAVCQLELYVSKTVKWSV